MKNIPIDMVVLGLCGLLLLGGAYMSYTAFNKIEIVTTSDSAERKKFLAEDAAKQKINFFSLPKIQTNVEHSFDRMVQAELTVVLEPEEGIATASFKPYESAIVDMVISIVAQSSTDDLSNVSGKITLSEKIKNGINEMMKKPSVKRVLFSTFSVQLQ